MHQKDRIRFFILQYSYLFEITIYFFFVFNGNDCEPIVNRGRGGFNHILIQWQSTPTIISTHALHTVIDK